MSAVNTVVTCKQMPRRILVSGFEAFGGATINPTQRLIEELRAGRGSSTPVETVLLPVVFGAAFTALEEAIARTKPDVVLSLGQAGGRDAIELERVAINLMDAEIADNNGFQPREQSIAAGGENALFSTLPLQTMLQDLRSQEIPARISNSAGLYVCNDLFYRLQTLGLTSGFVHVPYLPEQTTDKPSMPFETMKHALAVMLETLAR